MFPKLNLHDREVRKKQHIADHDSVSFKMDHFDRRFGINHFISSSDFMGVSGCEHLISPKWDYIDIECDVVGKAT